MPKNKIIPFDYGDNLIRVVEDETTGEPLWVAKDICSVLDLKDVNKAIQKLDDDEKLTRKFFVSGQNRSMYCITESGLYNLIFRSNKPEAKPFKRWVTHEVLPSIRKTGSYGVSDSSELLNQIVPALNAMTEMMQKMLEMLQNIQMQQMQQSKLLLEHKSDHLSPSQLDEIKLAANKAGKALADCHNLSWGHAMKEVYTELNGRMGVFSYYHISPNDFDDALVLLARMAVVKNEEAMSGKPVKLNIEVML